MKRQWETEELVEHWTLDVEDRTLLDNKTGATRLGFAVLRISGYHARLLQPPLPAHGARTARDPRLSLQQRAVSPSHTRAATGQGLFHSPRQYYPDHESIPINAGDFLVKTC